MSSKNPSDRTKGWLFVGVQFILIMLIIAVPSSDDWGWDKLSNWGGTALLVAGIAIMLFSALSLGSGLTANPEPSERGKLITNGLYGFVRHPIYFGLLVTLQGSVLGSQSFYALGAFIIFSIFLHFKASWEEERLAAVYPEYEEYAAKTPRLIPFLNLITDRL